MHFLIQHLVWHFQIQHFKLQCRGVCSLSLWKRHAAPESQPVSNIYYLHARKQKNLTSSTRNNCFVAQVVMLLSKPKYQPALLLAPWLLSEKYAHCLQFQSIYPPSFHLLVESNYHCQEVTQHLKISKMYISVIITGNSWDVRQIPYSKPVNTRLSTTSLYSCWMSWIRVLNQEIRKTSLGCCLNSHGWISYPSREAGAMDTCLIPYRAWQ